VGVTFDAFQGALSAAGVHPPRWVGQESEVVGLPLMPGAWRVGVTAEQMARAFALPTSLQLPPRRAALDLRGLLEAVTLCGKYAYAAAEPVPRQARLEAVLLHLLGLAEPQDFVSRFATLRAPLRFVPPAVAPRWRKTGRAACAH
jgi:hypothetical protein